jgi:hypothetical protein
MLASMTYLWATERALVTGNEIRRIVAHRCVIEVSIGKHIESLHSPGHRSNHRAAQRQHSPGHRSNIGSIVHIEA